MGYKPRKGSSNGRCKLHAVRQHRSSKNHAGLSSCIHRRVGGEGLRKVRNYIMKALNFGVESGYLVPTDQSYKMLRVSSDLLGKQRRRRTTSKTRYSSKVCESSRCSREREKEDEPDDDIRSTRFEDYPVQDATRKRRKSRRRSTSRSRRRKRRSRRTSRRRRRTDENPEEAGEDDDDDDYELDDSAAKKSSRTEHTTNDSRNTRSKTQVNTKNNAEGTDDISDVSIDEDDTDEDDDKKKDNTKKS